MPVESRVLAVASDAGSARALVPVLRLLMSRHVSVSALASGAAADILPAEAPDMATRVVDDNLDADVCAALVEESADVVVTGAGAYNLLEHTARLAARRTTRRTVAVLDYWFEYAARFHRPSAERVVESWPDVVCALDERSRRGLIEAGCVPDRVAVTGSPNLEESVRWYREQTRSRADLRRDFGLAPDRPTVAFFSEPYRAKPDGRPLVGPAGLCRDDGSPVFGYTAAGMLERTAQALRAAAGRRGVRAQIIVKAHPLEWAPPLHDFAGRWHDDNVAVVVVENANPKAIVRLSDSVVGMSSVTLVEAALVGRRAFSVQIGFDPAAGFDPCAGNALGVTTPVFDEEALARAAELMLTVDSPPARSRVADVRIEGSAAMVADVVVRCLSLV